MIDAFQAIGLTVLPDLAIASCDGFQLNVVDSPRQDVRWLLSRALSQRACDIDRSDTIALKGVTPAAATAGMMQQLDAQHRAILERAMTGAVATNADLWSQGKLPGPWCDHCSSLGLQVVDSLAHRHFACPAFALQRVPFSGIVGNKTSLPESVVQNCLLGETPDLVTKHVQCAAHRLLPVEQVADNHPRFHTDGSCWYPADLD